MSILFGLLFARRFYCRTALSFSPGRTGGLLPRINAPKIAVTNNLIFVTAFFILKIQLSFQRRHSLFYIACQVLLYLS